MFCYHRVKSRHYLKLSLIVVLLWLTSLQVVNAHQQRPAIISIHFDHQSMVKIQLETNVEALLSGIGSEHENTDDAPQVEVYRELRKLAPGKLTAKFNKFANEYSKGLRLEISGKMMDWKFEIIKVPEVGDTRLSRKSVIEYSGSLPAEGSSAVWSYAAEYGDAVINFITEGITDKTTYWLVKGEESPAYLLNQKVIPRIWYNVALDYTGLGYIHILPKGLDHILFVLGLFLLSRKFKPLLWQVTAFTLAHTITLALSIYGVISVSSLIIEPLIALSIAYVGIENLLTRELKPWRVVIVFIFGLLHGMGFAGVLTELGLPESQFITALISFNIGVEFGQLSVILLALFAVFWIRNKEEIYRKAVIVPASLGISLMGLYWTWVRIM